MHAVVFDEPGDESVLRVAEVPDPDCGPGEVRIRLAAAGVNRADLLQRRGLYPPPPGASQILGLECAGTVSEVGDGVEGFAVGDRVMALLAGGGYAEQVVVPAPCVMAVPDSLGDVEAGGVPEVFITAFLNLFLVGGLEPGATALVHGGSGGVGTAAIQLVKA
ncbi:MAG TPA: alcohol dehydrogenase catalytic domain-containing protein, partial [Chondromyces sp.]|nr:alcohol dehydrogenase catalytic domain-containing protein [Chondromyces sp.]